MNGEVVRGGSGAVAESRRFIFIGAFNFLTQAAMN
jgi:hypothetical protein